jgi:hypothetical protein
MAEYVCPTSNASCKSARFGLPHRTGTTRKPSRVVGWRRSIRQRALIRFVKRVTEATPSAIVNLIDAPTASCLEDSFSGDNTNTVLKQGNPGGPLRGPAGDAKPPGNERLASGAARNRLRPPARGPASGQLAPLRQAVAHTCRPRFPEPFGLGK